MCFKKAVIFIILLFSANLVEAKKINVISSATSETKEMAIHEALLDATRKASGVMLVDNSVVSNDEMVEQQLASFSKGKVIKYTEVSSDYLEPTKQWSVTLKVEVESSKIVKYTNQTGKNTATIDGEGFMFNKKVMDMQTENEPKVICDLLCRLYEMRSCIYDYVLYQRESPKMNNDPGKHQGKYFTRVAVKVVEGDNYKKVTSMIQNVLKSLSMSNNDRKEFTSFYNKDGYTYDKMYFRNPESVKLLQQWIPLIFKTARKAFKITDDVGHTFIPKVQSSDKYLFKVVFHHTEEELSQNNDLRCVGYPDAKIQFDLNTDYTWWPPTLKLEYTNEAEKANELFGAQKYNEAIPHLKYIVDIQHKENGATPLIWLAVAYAKTGQHQDAYDYLKKLDELYPHPYNHILYGYLFMEEGKEKDARDIWKQCKEKYGNIECSELFFLDDDDVQHTVWDFILKTMLDGPWAKDYKDAMKILDEQDAAKNNVSNKANATKNGPNNNSKAKNRTGKKGKHSK